MSYKQTNKVFFLVHKMESDIAGTQYDVAHVILGVDWRMPIINQFKEQLENCDNEWTTLNGVKGCKFTSKQKGNSIFLPVAGGRRYGKPINIGMYGHYRSSTQYPSKSSRSFGLNFQRTNVERNYYLRFLGLSIRPVSK